MFDGFSKKGIEFLKELEVNNTKTWFENHRSVWEKEILFPNTCFVQEMGETLQILVPTIHFRPKVAGSLFKIYRDVRFSKDKTPMKSKIGLLFWQGQAYRMQSSSFYMHYDTNSYFIATGIRNFKSPLLKTYREYIKIKKHRNTLHVILENLKNQGYNLPEMKYKRIPFGFDKDEENIYLSRYNCMFAYKEFDIDEVFYTEEIIDRAFKVYEDMSALQSWVYEMSLTSKAS